MESNRGIGKEKIDKMREEEATSVHFDYPRSAVEGHQPVKCSKALANIPT